MRCYKVHLFVILGLIFWRNLSQICNEDRQCFNNGDYCDDVDCHLICNGTQSCKNLKYKCNSTDPLSTCSIVCNGYESCENIDIYSTATINIINCNDWPSCINGNIHCNSFNTNNSSCTINCDSSRSCESLSFYCSNTTNICNLNCINEPDSCSNIDYDCNAKTLCDYTCTDTINSCSNLNCPQCFDGSTTTSTSTTTTTTITTTTATTSITGTVIVDNSDIISSTSEPPKYVHEEMGIDTNRISSSGYHITFGIFFLFTFFYILYRLFANIEFFKRSSKIDSIFSLLPIILFLTMYEIISCFAMGRNNRYLSSRYLKSSDLFWCMIPPLHLIIIIGHILIWYLYLIYYGKISSLNYLYTISSKISPKYPRTLFFVPMIILLIWFFIVMIITYSINASSNSSSRIFVCFIIIFECVFGIFMSIKLMTISINFVEMEYFVPKHEDNTMKLLFFCGISYFIVFITLFITAIGIYDEGNYQYQSYLPDIIRVFQLFFEILFIILCSILFVYIAPLPELHKMHRSSFHTPFEPDDNDDIDVNDNHNDNDNAMMMEALKGQNTTTYHPSTPQTNNNNNNNDNDNDDDYDYGIDDVDNVFTKNTKVYVRKKQRWILGTIKKLANNNTLCFVNKDDDNNDNKDSDDDNDEDDNYIVIDLNSKESKDIKLALFGIDPSFLPSSRDEKYNLNPVPNILINLRDLLFSLGGQYENGIFRKEAMKTKYNRFKYAVEQNRIDSFNYDQFDVHNISCLIKDFYRSMPNHLRCLQSLDFTDNDINNEICSVQDMKQLLNNKNKNFKFNQRISKILTVWLWNLCADICQNSAKNKMTINGLATVFAPNLYYQYDQNEYIKIQQNITQFSQLGIEYIVHKRQQK